MLTSKEYGVVDLISTISMVLVPVLVLNINESVMRFSLDKDANYNQIMSAGLLSLFLAVVVGILIFPISGMISGIQQYAGYLYFYTISSVKITIVFMLLKRKRKINALRMWQYFKHILCCDFKYYFSCSIKGWNSRVFKSIYYC